MSSRRDRYSGSVLRPRCLVAHLGPLPGDMASRDRWVEAAGRIAQHHALWPIADGVLVGLPPLDGPAELALTYYAATTAIAELDRTMGVDRRSVDHAGPGLSL